jgi:hypothetical protein
MLDHYLDFDFSAFASFVAYFTISPSLYEVPRPCFTGKLEVGGYRRFLCHSEIHTRLGYGWSSTESVRFPLDYT